MTSADIELHAQADRVRCELTAQDDAWGTSGWTRRRFLAGAGMAGVAALGSQLVTTRAAYAASPSTTDRSLVVVFLRGAADGLRISWCRTRRVSASTTCSRCGPACYPAPRH